MYENVYMSGLKQKAAGEAAKAKEKAKAAEDIEKSINVDPSKYHYSMQSLVKEKSAEAVTKMRDAIAEDNVRGINKANDIKRDLLIDLAGMANASNQLFEREKPAYTSTYIRPEVTFSKLNSMDIREAAKDPAVAKELADYGWQINVDDKGRVSINFSDIKNFDVRKEYNTFQGDIINQFAPQLAERFRVGGTTRQELSQVITKERSDAYLDLISSDPVGGRSAVFNWKNRYNVDITTPEGKQKVYDTFVAPEKSAVTSRPGMNINVGGGGSLAESAEVSKGTKVGASAALGWRPVAQDDGRFKLQSVFDKNVFVKGENGGDLSFVNKKVAQKYAEDNGKKEFDSATLNVGSETVSLTIPPNQAFAIGEGSSQTSFGQRIESSNVDAKVSRLATVTVSKKDKPVTIGLFTIRKGDVIPNDMLDKFSETEKEPKLFIVAESAPALNFTGAERVSGATIYVPATKDNLNAVIKGIPSGQKDLIRKIEKIRDKSETLEGAGPIGAAGKQTGAEKPQSFDLLNFEQPTA